MEIYRNTWALVNLDNIKYNLKKLINKNIYKYYFGVVKANAYSHGDIEISKIIIKEGINYLAVSSLEEAIKIRKVLKSIPILCLEPININYIKIAEKNNITLTVSDIDYCRKLSKINLDNKIKIHIKIDTGMNRLGVKKEKEFDEAIYLLNKNNNIIIEGLFTHFATADNNKEFYEFQINRFLDITKNIDLTKFEIIHLDNSAASINYPKINFANGARIGISMYGINPTNKSLDLKPIISLHSKIIQIKEIKKSERVGYSLNYKANEDEKIAIIPIGYADGIIRKNTGRYVLINNKKYKIIGNICMDMLMVLIDDTVNKNDIVTLIGGEITTSYIANYLDTIEYEIICCISDRVPRLYLENGKIINKECARFK